MKAVGQTSGGSLLLEINLSEARLLDAMAQALRPLQEPAAPEPLLVQAAPLQLPPALRASRRSHSQKRIAKADRRASAKPHNLPRNKTPRDKTCGICGTAFRDSSRTNTRRFCSAKCRKSSLDNWKAARRKPKAVRIPAPAVASFSRADRLAIIKAADRKALAEKDPLAQAGDILRRTHEEEG